MPVAPRLILASASPRRRELLAQLKVPFEVVTADVSEDEDPKANPRLMVAQNSRLKADWVAARNPDAIVLGADTVVCIDDTVLNKPRDLDDARRMLRSLSGRTHAVMTGLAVRQPQREAPIEEIVTTEVVFRLLDEMAISDYLAKVHVLDKAGAYAVQEHGDMIVASYRGSWSNIVGLPLKTTKHILTQCGLVI